MDIVKVFLLLNEYVDPLFYFKNQVPLRKTINRPAKFKGKSMSSFISRELPYKVNQNTKFSKYREN